MNLFEVMQHGFEDELRKIAASKSRMNVPKARTGRRSMRVSTLLRKDKDGTLFKSGGPRPGDVPSMDGKAVNPVSPNRLTLDSQSDVTAIPATSISNR